jgi:hypothetical protein
MAMWKRRQASDSSFEIALERASTPEMRRRTKKISALNAETRYRYPVLHEEVLTR